MASKVEDQFKNADVANAMREWTRLSSNVWSNSMRLGQPLIEAYLKSLSGAAAEMGKAYGKSCQIPETECPPYCVCELEWEAFQRDTVKGSIDVYNTGEQASQFSLSGDEFRAASDLSSVKPALNPASFTLQPGESQRVEVSVQVGESMDPDQTYHSEVKIAGRYEQCVRLVVHVRRRLFPNCRVDHGEIPTRIRAHRWYDHFQCEELCFEPVRRLQREPVKPVAKAAVAKRVASSKQATAKKASASKKS